MSSPYADTDHDMVTPHTSVTPITPALDLASASAQSAAEAQAKIDAAARPIKRKRTTTSTADSSSTQASNGSSSGINYPRPPIRPPSFDSRLDVLSPSVQSSIQGAILAQVYPHMSSFAPHFYKQLPGPQPASIARRDLTVLNQNEYWACEKSDGERARGASSMLQEFTFCARFNHQPRSFDRQGTFIIDRKFLVKRVNHPVYAEMWSKEGDSLMDGELVLHDNVTFGPTATFMAFDLLLLNGVRVMDQNLSERLKAIGNLVVLPYRKRFPQFATFPWTQSAPSTSANDSAAASSTATPLPDLPLAIRAKSFSPATRLYSGVFKHIHPEVSPTTGDCEYHYDDGKRKNKNDGIIFTPEKDNYWCKKVPLLKWKWPELNTIDFLVQSPWFDSEGKLMLYSTASALSSYGGKPDVVTIHIRSTQLEPAKRTWFLQQVAGKQSAIVEMQYDLKTSHWKPKTFRWDKSTPNFMSTVIGTLETMMDGVTPDDLYKACRDESSGQRESTTTLTTRPTTDSPNSTVASDHSNSMNGFITNTTIDMPPSLPPLIASRTTEAFQLIYSAREETLVKSSRLFGD